MIVKRQEVMLKSEKVENEAINTVRHGLHTNKQQGLASKVTEGQQIELAGIIRSDYQASLNAGRAVSHILSTI